MSQSNWFYRALESRVWREVTRLMLRLPLPLRLAIVLPVGIALIVVAVVLPALLLIYGLRLR